MSTTHPIGVQGRPHVRARVLVVTGLAAALASALLAGAAASTRAAPSWVNTGPEGGYLGGHYEVIAIHPKSPQVVYASTYYGLFRSTDGGATWQRRPAAPPWLSQVALDPADPQTLYALASGALYRTTNAGASWVELPRPSTDFHRNLILVTVSRSSPQTLYLVSYSGGVSGSGDDPGVPVFSSADAGRTWAQVGRIEAVGRHQPAAIFVDPRSPRTVYIWVWLKGIFRSEDGGVSWTSASAGLPIAKLSSVAAHPTRSGVLYAGTERGDVFRSLDAGSTWRTVARGLDREVTDLAVSAADGAVYAGTSARDRGDGVESGGGVVYRSADGRAPWRARSDGLTGWNVRALVAHPTAPGTVLAGTEHGVFGTRNGGASWVERVTGLVASSPTGLAVDPANAGTVFATVERGIAVSRDGGRTWGTALDLRRERAEVGSLLAVPGTRVTLYAVKRSHAAPNSRSILLTSRDAGRTWAEVGALPHSVDSFGAALVGDPRDADTLYFVARGIFKSVDAGRAWTRIYSAVDKPAAAALAVDPFDSRVLYALVRGRLRMSKNGGRTWQQLPGILERGFEQGIRLLVPDPHRRGTLYAVTGGWVNLAYVSKDRGRTWSKLGESQWVGTLLVDPVRSGVVYVGESNGVYVKRPGATTWQAVGPAGRDVRWLATDAKGGRLYAGIEGGGVAATRLPLPTAGIRRSAASSHSSAKPGARFASTTSGLIAFIASDGLYLMRADGSGVRALRRDVALPYRVGGSGLAWSRDGSELAFTDVGIWVVDADGTNLRRLVRGHMTSPTWSPDGRRIAFGAWGDIRVVNTDGSNIRRLTKTHGFPAWLDWSPAGGRIAFSFFDWDPAVYVMDTSGRNVRRLAPGFRPEWSPDGRRIAFVQEGGVWVMDARGRNVRRLAEGSDPEWSPDGRRIAFVRGRGIWVIDARGRNVRRLTQGDDPEWSPDGRRIAFVRSEEIYVMNADGTGVSRTRINGGRPVWQPVARRPPQPTSRS